MDTLTRIWDSVSRIEILSTTGFGERTALVVTVVVLGVLCWSLFVFQESETSYSSKVAHRGQHPKP